MRSINATAPELLGLVNDTRKTRPCQVGMAPSRRLRSQPL